MKRLTMRCAGPLALWCLAGAGCSMYLNLPSAEETQAYQDKMQEVAVGTPEARVLELFPKPTKPRKIGIIDTDSFQAQGYDKRGYWIGYWGANASSGSTRIEYVRYVCITCVNGVVDSIYYP